MSATLAPAPRDPVRHLEAAHAQARRHLVRLGAHDPACPVRSFMTEEMFSRLTDGLPAALTAPAGVTRYTYTPRKVLRRVLDHALDHLNQIDQWLAWERDGIVPTPTDGWVPSTVTLPDDVLPLAPADLDAWLWRIDQAARLVQQPWDSPGRAGPAGGAAPRRPASSARSERLYAAAPRRGATRRPPAGGIRRGAGDPGRPCGRRAQAERTRPPSTLVDGVLHTPAAPSTRSAIERERPGGDSRNVEAGDPAVPRRIPGPAGATPRGSSPERGAAPRWRPADAAPHRRRHRLAQLREIARARAALLDGRRAGGEPERRAECSGVSSPSCS